MIQVSPSVSVTERDLTNIIPAVSSSVGASYVSAAWGPIEQPVLVPSENALVRIFGKPSASNAGNWFPIAQFLAYSGACYVTRTDITASGVSSALNATTGTTAKLIKNSATYPTDVMSATIANGAFAAKYAGDLGNSLRVSVCDSKKMFETGGPGGTAWEYASLFSGPPGTSDHIKGITENAFANDEMHIVIIDTRGTWSGVPNTILETYSYLSKAKNARNDSNTSNYYVNVLNKNSAYVWCLDGPDPATLMVNGKLVADADPDANKDQDAAGTPIAQFVTWGDIAEGPIKTVGQPDKFYKFDSLLALYTKDFRGGTYNPSAVTSADKIQALSKYQTADEIDVSLVFLGEADRTTITWGISNIADSRKDCLLFITPTELASSSDTIGNYITDQDPLAAEKTVAFKNGDGSTNVSLPSSSYIVYDSGYKEIYDTYNDAYVWIPSNGDTAGLCARTDRTDDPWFSPAGFNRGQLKNTIRLAFNPKQAARDLLYLQGINPIVSFVGQGVVLYGDKTGLSKPSAFDRINVRRLFIVLEKAISTAAKYQLFELNDPFTRAHFKNMVEPFLRDVKGRRGLYDFKVVCDESNNTPQVIDSNSFVGDIYVKPARSINWVRLNFVAVGSGATFDESIVANVNTL